MEENDIQTEVKRFLVPLAKQRTQATVFYKYYEGDQPLVFTYEKLLSIFGRSGLNFVLNWCAVVIDSVLDRLIFKGWDSNENPNDYQEITLPSVSRSMLSTLAYNIHRDALVTGNGYIIMEQLEDGSIKGYRNDPKYTVVLYDGEDPDVPSEAAKLWREGETYRLNIYYPEVTEKYSLSSLEENATITFIESVSNPFAPKLPVVHFKVDFKELQNVIPLQDAINKTFSDMMVVGEFNAFPQRYAVTQADITQLRSDPRSIMKFPKGGSDEEGTQIGEFQATQLTQYLESMDKLANFIAIISRTPKHYFQNAGASISGEALIVMEAPLVKKVERYIDLFSDHWMDYLSFFVDSTEGVVTVWDRVATEQANSEATAIETLVRAGVPLNTVVRRFGWSESEVSQMQKDMADEKKARADMATAAFELANLKMQESNEPGF